jgi:hypothetical protein
MKGDQSLLAVVIEVSLRMVERLMGHELARDHGLQVGVLLAQAWLLRCSGWSLVEAQVVRAALQGAQTEAVAVVGVVVVLKEEQTSSLEQIRKLTR